MKPLKGRIRNEINNYMLDCGFSFIFLSTGQMISIERGIKFRASNVDIQDHIKRTLRRLHI